MVTTNKPLYVRGLAGGEAAPQFPSRMRRKNDGAGFADLMEGSGVQAESAAASGRGEARHASRPGTDARLLQARALNTLGQMIEEGDDAGGLYKRKGLEAMRTALAASAPRAGAGQGGSGSSPVDPVGTGVNDAPARQTETRSAGSEKSAKGIALPDRRRGIPLRVPQGAGRAPVQNAALNRNRPTLETGSIHDVRETSRSRRAGKAAAVSRESTTPGRLAARFESGSEGIAAIGYDRTGGTSYGKYQIASRPGTMTAFLAFLDKEAPDLGQRLRSAGPANTGSRQGRMPQEWKAIAAAEPERFEQLQERFIRQSHYEPALAAVRRIGYDTREFSPAMQEVLWSTAVQHGPAGAARIFRQAAENLGQNNAHEQHLIREVYDLRAQRFGSSSARVQAAARKRMESEKLLALAMTERSGQTA